MVGVKRQRIESYDDTLIEEDNMTGYQHAPSTAPTTASSNPSPLVHDRQPPTPIADAEFDPPLRYPMVTPPPVRHCVSPWRPTSPASEPPAAQPSPPSPPHDAPPQADFDSMVDAAEKQVHRDAMVDIQHEHNKDRGVAISQACRPAKALMLQYAGGSLSPRCSTSGFQRCPCVCGSPNAFAGELTLR